MVKDVQLPVNSHTTPLATAAATTLGGPSTSSSSSSSSSSMGSNGSSSKASGVEQQLVTVGAVHQVTGVYEQYRCNYLVAADGAHSTIR